MSFQELLLSRRNLLLITLHFLFFIPLLAVECLNIWFISQTNASSSDNCKDLEEMVKTHLICLSIFLLVFPVYIFTMLQDRDRCKDLRRIYVFLASLPLYLLSSVAWAAGIVVLVMRYNTCADTVYFRLIIINSILPILMLLDYMFIERAASLFL
jgi:predicted membrane channel-forming protein YqfA (hemolysin III family)